jgi:N utilization substance protein A
MNSELIEALRQIEREKKIEPETVLEALKAALVSAYKRNYGSIPNVRVDISETGEIKSFN